MSEVPIIVLVAFHPLDAESAAVAAYLASVLEGERGAPGASVPVVFLPPGAGAAPPPVALPTEATRVLVVLLAGNQIAADDEWCEYAHGLFHACAAHGRARFLPVQMTKYAFPLDPRLSEVNFERVWQASPGSDGADPRATLVLRAVVHAACRLLDPRALGAGAPPVTVFVSHTKVDRGHEPRAVDGLVSILDATQPLGTWFDSGDIDAGSVFRRKIEEGVADSAMIAVVTDSYASRAWCRREVLLAKQYRRPVVVVDALRAGERRSFPYAGNVPVVRWNGDAWVVVDALLRETLRHLQAAALLSVVAGENDEVLPSAPELATVVGRTSGRTLLYPDPPLGGEELELLAGAGVRAETPLQRFLASVNKIALEKPVALSVSEAEDIGRLGLRLQHLEATYLELSRYLLLAGCKIAYGGHLEDDGYSRALFDIVSDPIVAAQPASRSDRRIHSYIGWPLPLTIEELARWGVSVRFVRVPRPAGIDESLDPALVAEPQTWLAATTPERRYAWARGMSAMRAQQVTDTCARIVVGGRIGPGPERAGKWYVSRIPGVLEEILLSLKAGQPVYLIGALGGCARLVFDVLEGNDREELSWAWQRHAPHAEAMRTLYGQRGDPWLDYPEIIDTLRARGLDGLDNGLSLAENRELGRTRSVARMVELVLKGLGSLRARGA